MIEKIFYSDGTTYIDDEKGNCIKTNNLTIKEAMQLAFNVKCPFDIDSTNEYDIRQGIHAFSEIHNIKTLFDFYNDLSMHLLNHNIIKDFSWDMNNGMPQLFNFILKNEYKDKYKPVTNNMLEWYVRHDIAFQLSTINDNKAKKYYKLFSNTETDINEIQKEIFDDNDALYNEKIIAWIDIHYNNRIKEMELIGYNSNGNQVFNKIIKNVSRTQACETHSNLYKGMQSSDIYIDL